MCPAAHRQIVVGRIAGVFGVRGWVRVRSFTDPPGNILRYGPWCVGDTIHKDYRVTDGSVHGRGVIAHLEGVDDRDVARALIGASIRVPRAQFDAPAPGEFYWSDLIGLQVMNLEGIVLGRVSELLETGANDVLVVQDDRRRLVPFVPAVVRSVDLATGLISVDWDPDF